MRLDGEPLGHHSHHEGLRYGLTVADRQGVIAIGLGTHGLGNEAVPGHLPHRREHPRIVDASIGDEAVHHLVAVDPETVRPLERRRNRRHFTHCKGFSIEEKEGNRWTGRLSLALWTWDPRRRVEPTRNCRARARLRAYRRFARGTEEMVRSHAPGPRLGRQGPQLPQARIGVELSRPLRRP